MIKIGEMTFNNSPEEEFNMVLLDSIYTFRQLWNTIGFWTLDIRDENGDALVLGARIISGSFFLEQFPSIPFDLYNDTGVDPTRDGISDFILEIYSK